jgi:NADH-quinone oxidoreductase subunit J
MTIQLVLFFVLALVAIATALGMLLSRNAVYAALFLVLNFATVAVFYLLLNAPFISVAQVTVYAGAIMVLFLFVIMLLGGEKLNYPSKLPWQRPAAVVLGVILFAEAVLIVLGQRGLLPLDYPLPDSFGSPVDIGGNLFTTYLLPFEVTSVLLLVAIVGAIVLTKNEKK